MMDKLPKGWISIELEKHVYIAGRIGWRGLKRSEYTKTGPRFLAVKNILPNGQIDFSETDHLSEDRYAESPEIQLGANDILLTKDGTIGKVGMVDKLPGKTTVNSSILVIRPIDELLLDRYLFHYLRGPRFQQIARERITGSAIPHLFQKDIKKLRALVPPPSEQHRIVVKLENLLAKVDTCQQRLEKIPSLLKRFRQSILAAACCGRLTADWRAENPEISNARSAADDDLPTSWTNCVLKDVANVVSGFAFNSRDFTSAGVPAIKISNVQYGEFVEKSQEYLPESFLKRYPTYVVSPDTLLMALTRPITNDTLKVCLYPKAAKIGLLNQRVCKFEPSPEINRDYLHTFMQTLPFKLQVQENLSETLQPNLSPKALDSFSIVLPPLAEQKEIVRRAEHLLALADQLESRFIQARAQVDKLTPSILSRAFAGKLVPQDPNDEPAEKLLERIRAGRKTKRSLSDSRRQKAENCAE